ncbi:hypothetical protein [Pseudoroseicyclus sp. CXY001]|uniref:DUF7697 family protein n=1 Tax=Pseudoroseicyclus sp. CXY001 TaxID=3242492 RepID=UPI0035716F66
MIEGLLPVIGGQVRTSMAGAYGLDFSAIFKLAEGRGIDLAALSHFLPRIEDGALAGFRRMKDSVE